MINNMGDGSGSKCMKMTKICDSELNEKILASISVHIGYVQQFTLLQTLQRTNGIYKCASHPFLVTVKFHKSGNDDGCCVCGFITTRNTKHKVTVQISSTTEICSLFVLPIKRLISGGGACLHCYQMQN